VPTDKRARQRAARDQKQAVIEKSRKRRKNLRRGIGLAIVAALIVVIVFLVNSSSKSATPPTTTTTTTATTSTTVTTTTVPTGTTFPTPTTQPLTTAAVTPTCPPATGSTKRVVWFSAKPPTCISASSVFDATFETSVGNITVSMPTAASSAGVNNFVFLARYKYYDGTWFHRVIKGFVVQGGDPTGLGTGGVHALPGYSFTGNTPPASCKTKPNQSTCYQAGDLVYANSGAPSSNGSQFFFVLPGGQTVLNTEPVYTIFGKVTSAAGMAVLDKIGSYGAPDTSETGTPTVRVYLLKVTVTQVSG
jgi:cyclophilin family peptidyl-prolyl cis-trans isomerase/predicted nucleic acid-binding Zn ribbon protein